MSWMSELVDLYDRNQNKAGKVTNVKRRGKGYVRIIGVNSK